MLSPAVLEYADIATGATPSSILNVFLTVRLLNSAESSESILHPILPVEKFCDRISLLAPSILIPLGEPPVEVPTVITSALISPAVILSADKEPIFAFVIAASAIFAVAIKLGVAVVSAEKPESSPDPLTALTLTYHVGFVLVAVTLNRACVVVDLFIDPIKFVGAVVVPA